MTTPDRPSPAPAAEVERLAEALFALVNNSPWAYQTPAHKAFWRDRARRTLNYYIVQGWPLPGASAEQREG